MVPKIVHFLIAVQFACWMFYLPKDKRSVRPSVRPSCVCMIRFHSSGPAKRAMSAESPVTETCRDQQNRRGCFYTNGEGRRKKKRNKRPMLWASARDDMVVDGHRPLSVWWPTSGWMSGFPRRPCITAQQPGTSKQWQQLERHVDDIISKCAHL